MDAHDFNVNMLIEMLHYDVYFFGKRYSGDMVAVEVYK